MRNVASSNRHTNRAICHRTALPAHPTWARACVHGRHGSTRREDRPASRAAGQGLARRSSRTNARGSRAAGGERSCPVRPYHASARHAHALGYQRCCRWPKTQQPAGADAARKREVKGSAQFERSTARGLYGLDSRRAQDLREGTTPLRRQPSKPWAAHDGRVLTARAVRGGFSSTQPKWKSC